MPRHDDAYGAQLLAQLNGAHPTCELIERDDGLIDEGSEPGRYFAPFSKWPAPERRALQLARGAVLDIGAGAGRHALYLQGRGLPVTAIDDSKGAIEVCRRRGVLRARVLPIEQVQRLEPSRFDTVLMLGNNFGLLANPRRAKVLLRRLHRLTSPGARLIAEAGNPYLTSDPVHLAYHRKNRAAGRLPGQLRLRARYGNRIGRWFEYLFVSPAEMRDILRGTGWQLKKMLGRRGLAYLVCLDRCLGGDGAGQEKASRTAPRGRHAALAGVHKHESNFVPRPSA